MDAKVIAAISDMDRHEIIATMCEVGCIFHHSEPTKRLREYIRTEYISGRIKSENVLANYDGGL